MYLPITLHLRTKFRFYLILLNYFYAKLNLLQLICLTFLMKKFTCQTQDFQVEIEAEGNLLEVTFQQLISSRISQY